MLFIVPLLLLWLRQALALPTISAKGSKLFTSDGTQFYIKGIAYQLTPYDPLSNPSQCKLDAALMKELGANSIRVYHVEPDQNHDACMSTFSDAGIYAWIDLDTVDTYIMPDWPFSIPHWNETQYVRYQQVMDVFQQYDNTAGFFVGNEMLTTGPNSTAAPYIKAAARDMKAYRDSKGYRNIPIGYSAADIPALRPNLQNYLACGTNSSETVDFYSLNAYEWCGQSSYDQSGYSILEQNATDYDLPIFISETGCIKPEPRTFDDQSAILGPDMDDTWSGAIVYEWIEVANGYGLISYGPPTNPTATGANVMGGFTVAGTPTPISPDFDNLKSQWATLTPKGISADAYKPSLTPPPCPASTSGLWEVDANAPLPTLGAKGTDYTKSAASASASASTSANSASSRNRSMSRGTSPIEGWFKDAAAHNHVLFWVVGVLVAIGGPALVL